MILQELHFVYVAVVQQYSQRHCADEPSGRARGKYWVDDGLFYCCYCFTSDTTSIQKEGLLCALHL